MAKTYVLNSISMNCGRRTTWSDADWSGYIGNDAEGLRAGYYQNNYRATNILFDSTTLSSLRSKTVTSISLTVTVASGTLPVSTATGFPIGYKLNSTATTESNGAAWTRSNAASTAASTTVSVGYITSGNASTQSITSNTIRRDSDRRHERDRLYSQTFLQRERRFRSSFGTVRERNDYRHTIIHVHDPEHGTDAGRILL